MTEPSPPTNTRSVLRRNKEVAPFNNEKIAIAIAKAFIAVKGDAIRHSKSVASDIRQMTEHVCDRLFQFHPENAPIHIEQIQDQVELVLMRSGHHDVARAYVIYREKRNEARREQQKANEPTITVQYADGDKHPLSYAWLKQKITTYASDLAHINIDTLFDFVEQDLYQNMPLKEVYEAVCLNAKSMVEDHPNYSHVGARALLDMMYQDAYAYLLPHQARDAMDTTPYTEAYLTAYLTRGTEHGLLDARLLTDFDIPTLAAALNVRRDQQFAYLGIRNLYDRYFIHINKQVIELPQAFFMRVAMGLALNETDKTARALEFYKVLAAFDFMSSTPTLFNSGTRFPQLSSCYLTTVEDDLESIYNGYRDNALLSKYAGGLGNDWTPIRAANSRIKGTNGHSNGVIPFLKVADSSTSAVNQGGKRKGAVCAYLEVWHLDINAFTELRRNVGDDRVRAHDMNTAVWVPDEFMRRVMHDEPWTLFSPDDTPDLHDLYGKAFSTRYKAYETMAANGEITNTHTMPAKVLWHKIIEMLYTTGHPWITFKDPCNLRSPQSHAGVVHSSNLCTEITLNTSKDEIAVCNLGSINLVQHLDADGQLDEAHLKRTISTAIRMLDNVIEYNYYAVEKARTSNLKHRPIGLGLMGFHDALMKQGISYASEEAVAFADRSMEMISYYAISASSDLAAERGAYESYEGSLWSQGILPIDSIERLSEARDGLLKQDRGHQMDWDSVRTKVKNQGMRNSNTMAIAPTATISNIVGVSSGIDPIHANLYTTSNMSGDFSINNRFLVDKLTELGLWDEAMISDLRVYGGSVKAIERIPENIRALFPTAGEVGNNWLIEAGSRRQKWLDQAQSLNLFCNADTTDKDLDEAYKNAWMRGLKTTYYLRGVEASSAEKTQAMDSANNSGVQLDTAMPDTPQ